MGLRLLFLGQASLQVDEAMSLLAAAQWTTNPDFDVHPPLFLILLDGWSHLALSEWWLRLLPVLANLGSLWVWWRLRGCWRSLLMLVVSFAEIQQCREVRMYAWLEFFALAHVWSLQSGKQFASALTLAAACFTHLFGVFLVPLGWFGKRWKHNWVLLPWLVWAVPHYLAHQDHLFGLRQTPTLWMAGEAVGRVAGGRVVAFGDLFSEVLGGAALLWLAWRRPKRPGWVYAWALGPWLTLWLLSRLTPIQLFEFKYLYWTTPAWACLFSDAWLAWVVLNGVGLLPWLLFPHQYQADWRLVADFIRQTPGRRVVVHPSMMSAPLFYYGIQELQPLDEWSQMKPEGNLLWITTPHHPFVVRQGLKVGLEKYWRCVRTLPLECSVPSCVIEVSLWDWAGPASGGRESGGPRG